MCMFCMRLEGGEGIYLPFICSHSELLTNRFWFFIDQRIVRKIMRSTEVSCTDQSSAIESFRSLAIKTVAVPWWIERTTAAESTVTTPLHLSMVARSRLSMSRAIEVTSTSRPCPHLGLSQSWRKPKTSTTRFLTTPAPTLIIPISLTVPENAIKPLMLRSVILT